MKRGLMLCVCALGLSIWAESPSIHYTASSPFQSDGARVESAWGAADTLTRFIERPAMAVALDDSSTQMLFDDTALYVSLVGKFDKNYARGNPGTPLGEGNAFAFSFIGTNEVETAIAVDEFGRSRLTRGGTDVPSPGIGVAVSTNAASWTANLTIPLSALGMDAPAEDCPVRIGIMRRNVNVHPNQKTEGERVILSYYTPDGEMADAVMTRAEGEPKTCKAPLDGHRVSLVPNCEFDAPNRNWLTYPGVVYMESMAMSEEWMYRAEGNIYQCLSCGAAGLKPSSQYTLAIRARRFGGGCGIRVVQMVRPTPSSPLQEGAYPVNNQPLTDEFHEYYFPFTTSPNLSAMLIFYKMDEKKAGMGMDIASIRLYEGTVEELEVRKIAPSGRQLPIAGTEIPTGTNAYGASPRPLRALALAYNRAAMREMDEIAAGLSAQVDVLACTGTDCDAYESSEDEATIRARIENGEYDLYMVPRNGATRVGKVLARQINAACTNGVPVYFERQNGNAKGHFAGMPVTPVALAGSNGYLPSVSASEAGVTDFPHELFNRATIARQMYRVAFGEPAIPADATCRTNEVVYAGVRHRAVWTLDADGKTLDWDHYAEPVDGPMLGAFSDSGNRAAIAIAGDCGGAALKWSFADCSGRILAEGLVEAAPAVGFGIPRHLLYTNLGKVTLELRRGNEILDHRVEAVYAPDNDGARLYDDFTVSVWPIGNVASPAEMAAGNRQLADIGVTASLMPNGGSSYYNLYLGAGIGVGGAPLGGYDTFGGYLQNSNVRQQQFNRAGWHEEKFESVRMASASRSKYGLVSSQICDEPNFSNPSSDNELDAHPDNLAVYRERMEQKYGSITNYNARHRTTYGAFADLDQALLADARAKTNASEFIEWRNFNVDRWCEAIKTVSDGAKVGDPRSRMALGNSFGQGFFSGNDYWKLLTKAGLDHSLEYTAMVYMGRDPMSNFDEFYRSFRPDMRVWGWTGYGMSTPWIRFQPWWFACHRYGGFSWFAADAADYCLIDMRTFARTRDGDDLRNTLAETRLMEGLGKVLTCWPWAKRDIAIYYSHESLLLAAVRGTETRNSQLNSNTPLYNYMYSRQGAQYLVEDLLYQHDFVAPEQVVGEADVRLSSSPSPKLSAYKVLFMPRIIAMSDAEVDAVKAFLAAGGRVIADELPGGADELGIPREVNPFEGLSGIAVTGKNFDDRDKAQRNDTLAALRLAGATAALACDTITNNVGREAMHYVSGDADLYAVLRKSGFSSDANEDAFVFAKAGHVYDVRSQAYLGFGDRVTAAVPKSDASVFAVLPAPLTAIEISGVPSSVTGGWVLPMQFRLAGAGTAQHALHVEIVPPSGMVGVVLKRNLFVTDGIARLDFATARNDEPGTWTVRVTEAFSGLSAEQAFELVKPLPEALEPAHEQEPFFSVVSGTPAETYAEGLKKVFVFTNDVTLNVVHDIAVDMMLVGGGGGGGADRGGGGGGGGVVVTNGVRVTPGEYVLKIGAGGAGAASPVVRREMGHDGLPTTAFGVTALGGGGGGTRAGGGPGGRAGGCGGGAGSQYFIGNSGFTAPGGMGVQGFDGGASTNTTSHWLASGGGGGGAGGPGENAFITSTDYGSGSGGIGLACPFLGRRLYAGGGGGGNGHSGAYFSPGGAGGGGRGGWSNASLRYPGVDGAPGTGGGGGGGGAYVETASQYTPGGNGGSGAIVLRCFAGSASIVDVTATCDYGDLSTNGEVRVESGEALTLSVENATRQVLGFVVDGAFVPGETYAFTAPEEPVFVRVTEVVFGTAGSEEGVWLWREGVGTGGTNWTDWTEPANWRDGVVAAGATCAANLTAATNQYVRLPAMTLPLKRAYGTDTRSAVLCGDGLLQWRSPSGNISGVTLYTPWSYQNNSAYQGLHGITVCADCTSLYGSALWFGTNRIRLDRYADSPDPVRPNASLPSDQYVRVNSDGGLVFVAPCGADAAQTSPWSQTAGSPFLAPCGEVGVLPVGTAVTGAGIPDGAFLKRIFPDGTVELSAAATATVVSNALTFAAFAPQASVRLGAYRGYNTAGLKTLAVEKYRETDCFRVEIGNFGRDSGSLEGNGTFRIYTEAGFVPGDIALVGGHGTAEAVLRLENVRLEIVGNYPHLTLSVPSGTDHVARVSVPDGKSVTVGTLTDVKGTFVKAGGGTLNVGVTDGALAGPTARVVVEEGVFVPTVSGGREGMTLRDVTIKAGATLMVFEGLRIGTLRVEKGSIISGPAKLDIGTLAEGSLDDIFLQGGAMVLDSNPSGGKLLHIDLKSGEVEKSRTDGYELICIRSNATFRVRGTGTFDLLLVGGGGGGGNYSGGGGGGGGVVYTQNVAVAEGLYGITAGAGGTAGFGNTDGASGANTTAFGITAYGGGGGAYSTKGKDGATGGGAGANYWYGAAAGVRKTNRGGDAIYGEQGFGGGASTNVFRTWANTQGGGGGGAGGVGGDCAVGRGGAGGAGRICDITGTPVAYGGGGGGGTASNAGSVGGLGGTGGGGKGGHGYYVGNTPMIVCGKDGTDGLGGGGGGGGSAADKGGDGGNGGRGIVILRIPNAAGTKLFIR